MFENTGSVWVGGGVGEGVVRSGRGGGGGGGGGGLGVVSQSHVIMSAYVRGDTLVE